MGQQVGRERAEHHQVEHAHFQAMLVAQVVCDHLGITDHRTLSGDDILRVFQAITHHAGIFPARKRCKFGKSLIGQVRDVIKIEGALCRHALGVALLVLHHAQHGGIIKIIQLGDAAAAFTEHGPLCPGRRIDDIRRITQVLANQLTFRFIK